MVEMKSGDVVLSLAGQLASWRAVLILLRTRATYKPRQREDSDPYSIFLADCLNHSQQPVWESAGGTAVTESRKVGKGRRERRYADVDEPGANPDEPDLGPRGPTLKKQARKGFDGPDLRLGLQPADSVDTAQHSKWFGGTISGVLFLMHPCSLRTGSLQEPMSPSPLRREATRPSPPSPSVVAPLPRWRRFFCCGNSK